MQYYSLSILSGLLAAVAFSWHYPGVAAYTNGAAVPKVIQGGMGVRISKWELAREVAREGQLGVVSGTVMDVVLVRELQNGDPEGSMRRALASFPDQGMANRILDKYFIEGGKDSHKPYKTLPMWSVTPSQHLLEVCVLANYCEVWLAKHNDDGSPIANGWVGLNLLTKVQLPTIPSLYGAMIAEVDYVLMGAGIPMKIPGILDNLADCKDCVQQLDLADRSEDVSLTFSPTDFWNAAGRPDLAVAYKRPKFLPIVSSVVLAQSMLKRASGSGPTKGIDGFVVELNTAGGHNAPPRGFKYDALTKTHAADLNERGEPVYGEKDDVDLEKFAKATNGLPFWLAGSFCDPEKLKHIVDIGGAGVQVGTAFAFSKESGMKADVKHAVLNELAHKDWGVFTDPQASPTGFPFKVLELEGTLSDSEVYEHRPRACSLGYLRDMYKKPDGSIGYRCAAEPVNDYVKKGGDIEATQGRKCLCNALCANVGFPQVQPKYDYEEEMLITVGDDVNNCKRYMRKNENGDFEYSARDVVSFLLSGLEDPAVEEKKEHKLTSLTP
jgi:NAD(P)H-dependent flavin oxidoreductase YrpB (nitropropane dioxygenase family)